MGLFSYQGYMLCGDNSKYVCPRVLSANLLYGTAIFTSPISMGATTPQNLPDAALNRQPGKYGVGKAEMHCTYPYVVLRITKKG